MTKKRRILIIEDDPSFAKLLERHLDKVSVTIDHVDNGTEGLSRIKSDLPEVVLLDLNLPDSNGMDILKNLEKENIPSEIIIITAHGNVNVAVEAPLPASVSVIQSGQEPAAFFANVTSVPSSSVAVKVTLSASSSVTLLASTSPSPSPLKYGASLIAVTVITNKSVAVRVPVPSSVVVHRTL